MCLFFLERDTRGLDTSSDPCTPAAQRRRYTPVPTSDARAPAARRTLQLEVLVTA